MILPTTFAIFKSNRIGSNKERDRRQSVSLPKSLEKLGFSYFGSVFFV